MRFYAFPFDEEKTYTRSKNTRAFFDSATQSALLCAPLCVCPSIVSTCVHETRATAALPCARAREPRLAKLSPENWRRPVGAKSEQIFFISRRQYGRALHGRYNNAGHDKRCASTFVCERRGNRKKSIDSLAYMQCARRCYSRRSLTPHGTYERCAREGLFWIFIWFFR